MITMQKWPRVQRLATSLLRANQLWHEFSMLSSLDFNFVFEVHGGSKKLGFVSSLGSIPTLIFSELNSPLDSLQTGSSSWRAIFVNVPIILLVL